MSDKQDLEPLLSTQQNDLAMISAQGDGIDNKSLAVLAVDVAALIFILESTGHSAIALLAITPFLASMLFACLALQPKKYIGASIDLDEHPEYLAMDRDTLLLQLLSDTQEVIKHNQRINLVHWRRTVISTAAALLGALGLFMLL